MKPAHSKKPSEKSRRRWYLLIHQLPPEPLYLRAKIRQRLSRVGAVALKNAVYVLPRRDECLEDFQWIAQEAMAGGGEAHVCEAGFLDPKTETDIVGQFRAERNTDYEELAQSLRASGPKEELPARLSRARKRFEEIVKIDFFDAPARSKIEKLLKSLEAEVRRVPKPSSGGGRSDLAGKTWVTRRGVHIDRIASAWFIRRFVDSKARFRFIDPKEPPRPGELRFDMVGGDFTHEGDRCTFETLLARPGLEDRALTEIAEIVHDIDLKDSKFARPEAPGLERVLTGLILANPEDEARLERGFVLFDELYQSFRKKLPASSKEVPR
jgi:hypothetical protein